MLNRMLTWALALTVVWAAAAVAAGWMAEQPLGVRLAVAAVALLVVIGIVKSRLWLMPIPAAMLLLAASLVIAVPGGADPGAVLALLAMLVAGGLWLIGAVVPGVRTIMKPLAAVVGAVAFAALVWLSLPPPWSLLALLIIAFTIWLGWVRISPAWLLMWRQFLFLRRKTHDEDPRDIDRIRWEQPPAHLDHHRLTMRYARADSSGYFLCTADAPETDWRSRWGLRDPGRLVVLTTDDMTKHTHVVGQTGSGKTTSVAAPLAVQHVLKGRGGLFLDFKHDPHFKQALEAACRAVGKTYHYISLDASTKHTWNPLAPGEPHEVAERVTRAVGMSAMPGDRERYFTELIREALTLVLSAAARRGVVLTCRRLYELVRETGQPPARALSGIGNPLRQYLAPYQDLLGQALKIRWENAGGLRSVALKLSLVPALNPQDGVGDVSMLAALRDELVVHASLDALEGPEMAAQVGRVLLGELAWAMSELRRDERSPLFMLMIDEFGNVVDSQFINLLSKARGFGVACVVLHQSHADLMTAGRELAEQIMHNVHTHVTFRLKTEREAEATAGMAGKVLRDYTFASVGEGGAVVEGLGRMNAAERESYNVHPNKLLMMPRGKAFVLLPSRCMLRDAHGRAPDTRSIPAAVWGNFQPLRLESLPLPEPEHAITVRVVRPEVRIVPREPLSLPSPSQAAAPATGALSSPQMTLADLFRANSSGDGSAAPQRRPTRRGKRGGRRHRAPAPVPVSVSTPHGGE